jgi:hypothetical protein
LFCCDTLLLTNGTGRSERLQNRQQIWPAFGLHHHQCCTRPAYHAPDAQRNNDRGELILNGEQPCRKRCMSKSNISGTCNVTLLVPTIRVARMQYLYVHDSPAISSVGTHRVSLCTSFDAEWRHSDTFILQALLPLAFCCAFFLSV